MRRAKAEVLNVAGRWAYRIGSATGWLWLCGVSGTLDAKADTAGYWEWHGTCRACGHDVGSGVRSCEVRGCPALALGDQHEALNPAKAEKLAEADRAL